MKIEITKYYWCGCSQSYYPHEGIRKKELHPKGHFRGYTHKIDDLCCLKMGYAIKKDFIKFGKYDDYCSKDCNMNIIHCDAWPDGATFSECPIQFCPFCTEEIIIKEAGDDN